MQGRLETEMKIEKEIDTMLKSSPDYVAEWHLNMKASRCTPATRKDYVKKIRMFLSYLNENIMEITPNMFSLVAAESFMISIQTKREKDGMIGYTSDSYQLTFWCVLSNFFEFMEKRNYIPYNYMRDIKRPKNEDLERINNERILLTKKDFKKLLKAVQKGKVYKRDSYEAYRNRDCLILLLLMTTGMRETALAEINVSDIDLDTYTLKIVDKGKKTHYYPLSEEVIKYLNLWLKDRKKANITDDALFIGRWDKRISGVGVARIVEKYSEVGLGYRLTPHKLRAGFCSILYNETHDTEFVRRAVGHANVGTTQRYIKTTGDEKKKASEFIDSIFK